MKYLLLLYASEDQLWQLSGVEQQSLWSRVERLSAAEERAWLYLLESTGAALTLRRRSDGLVLGGGSGIESDEQLQGCLVLEAVDLDAAVRIAASLPVAAIGSIEVRPARDLLQI